MLKKLALCCCVLALLACADKQRIPVSDLSQRSVKNGIYTVQRGDTLFSIAWSFDQTYQQLASRNNIPKPYTIYPGQKLYVTGPVVKNSTTKKTASKKKTSTQSKAKPRANTKVIVTKKPAAKKVNAVESNWVWPVQGTVIQKFSTKQPINKGINIAIAEGTAVKSARSGVVAYAGSQLKGYGKLIIIKHDNTYLSAYAHNRKILVKEGQQVKQGQKIAESGSSAVRKPQLHFEIRKQGKPVNPALFLPK